MGLPETLFRSSGPTSLRSGGLPECCSPSTQGYGFADLAGEQLQFRSPKLLEIYSVAAEWSTIRQVT